MSEDTDGGLAGQISKAVDEANADDATDDGRESPAADNGATPTDGGSEAEEDSPTDSDPEAESNEGEDTPEPRTLTETGLLDDDGQYPWDSDSETVVSDGKELEREIFTYLDIPFEVTEPEDGQAIENAADGMEGLQDARKPERQRIIQRYFQRLADICLTVDGTPHDEVYAVRRDGGDGGRDVLTHEVAEKYDLVDGAGDVNKRRANELDVVVKPLWDDLTEFQRTKLGQKMDGLTSGESSFRLFFFFFA